MVIGKLIVILIAMIVLLRLKFQIGHTVLISSLILWTLSGLNFEILGHAFVATLQDPRGWIIVGALYFIMWLEYLLRTRGVMDSFLVTIQAVIPNRKAVMMIISSFLGLLPSLGGAIFSAPMVKKLAEPLDMSVDDQNLINFWARHYADYANPMAPALLLACATANVPLDGMLASLIGYGVLAVVVGWIGCCWGIEDAPADKLEFKMSPSRTLFLALGPIALIFVLILIFKFNAAIATLIATSILTLILWRGFDDFKRQVTESFNVRIFWSVAAILFFQNILIDTGMVVGLTQFFQETGLSPVIGISVIAFIMGALTGMSQGFVAIVFPFVAGVASGNVPFAVLVYVAGTSGQMITPTHLCLTLSTSFFNADWGRTYLKLVPMQMAILIAAIAVYWIQAY